MREKHSWTITVCFLLQLFIFRTVKAESEDFTQCVTHGSFHERWQETAYNMFHFVTLYVIPLLVMSCCYTCILIEINRQLHKSQGTAAERLGQSINQKINQTNNQSIKQSVKQPINQSIKQIINHPENLTLI